MKKYIKIISLVLIALIFIGTFVFLYQKSQPKDTAYEILHSQTADLVQTTVATGKIEPRDEVQIKPQISGIISEVYKEAGETVKKVKSSPRSRSSPNWVPSIRLKAVSVWLKSTDDRPKRIWNAWKNSIRASW